MSADRRVTARLPDDLDARLERAISPGGALYRQGVRYRSPVVLLGIERVLDEAEKAV